MRILHLDSGREMRGGQWQALRLIEGLRAAGAECRLAARAGSPLFRAAAERRIDVRPLGWRELLRDTNLVHAHDGHTQARAAVAARAPLVVSRRVAFPVRSRLVRARTARFIAVSGFVRDVLEAGGAAPQKIAVVYDGVPLLPAARPDGLLAVAPASEDPRKGTALAAEAACRAGVPLLFSRNLERDLARASMFVYVTHTEGLGSGALMAMSAGVPVIASRVGGLPEIVNEGQNGMLVENSIDALAAAIRRLAEDADEARRMGARGRKMAADMFSVERMVEATMAVYRQVLA